jgi:RNA polymerase sigma-70 factor (ECF subfamily)
VFGRARSRRLRQAHDDSAEWLRSLAPQSPDHESAVERLHALLVRAAHTEIRRRSAAQPITGPELDDLAEQAASDAVLAVLRKLAEFRGDSRFTTWAYKFAILEVSSKLGRHFWQRPGATLDAEEWANLPDRFGFSPEEAVQSAALLDAVRKAVDAELTEHQRTVFVGAVVDGIPLDALADRMQTTRGALYKTLYDARRKIRASLVTNGYLDDTTTRSR